MRLIQQRYQVQKILAQSNDSRVYLAQDRSENKPVIVKEFDTQTLSNWKRFELIEREIQVLNQMGHPRIPQLLDAFTLEKNMKQKFYIVMQYFEGQNLEQKLNQNWQPSLDEILNIISQTLHILIYIHNFHPPIIHRDIKPSNLILNDEGEVFLIDFGGAQDKMPGQGSGGSTVVGTHGYFAPEEFMGKAVMASDLFALGMTCLKLHGYHPNDIGGAEFKASPMYLNTRIQAWLKNMTANNLDARFSKAMDALVALEKARGKDLKQLRLIQPLKNPNKRSFTSPLTPPPPNQPTHLEIGSPIGRYTVLRILGKGHFSTVYLAQDAEGNQVSIKELNLSLLDNIKSMELFEREIEIQKCLKHPLIPKFIESFQWEQDEQHFWYLVTQAIQGQTLAQLLEGGWRPPDHLIWKIAQDILEILDYLHTQTPTLVHRDVKPSNILLDNENKAHLIDFGSAQNKLLLQGGAGSTITGTFGYMAPEQFMGQSSPQSDLYGLGTTLIRMLSGYHPTELPLKGMGLDFESYVNCKPRYMTLLKKLVEPDLSDRLKSAEQAILHLNKNVSKQKNTQKLVFQNISAPRIQLKLSKATKIVILPQYKQYSFESFSEKNFKILNIMRNIIVFHVHFLKKFSIIKKYWLLSSGSIFVLFMLTNVIHEHFFNYLSMIQRQHYFDLYFIGAQINFWSSLCIIPMHSMYKSILDPSQTFISRFHFSSGQLKIISVTEKVTFICRTSEIQSIKVHEISPDFLLDFEFLPLVRQPDQYLKLYSVEIFHLGPEIDSKRKIIATCMKVLLPQGEAIELEETLNNSLITFKFSKETQKNQIGEW